MIKIIKRTLLSILLFIIFIAGLLYYFLNTTSGLHTAIKIASAYLPGTIKTAEVKGRLLDKFTIATLQYRYQKLEVNLNNLQVHWKLSAIVHRQLPVTDIQMQSLSIVNDNSQVIKQLKINLSIAGDENQIQWSGNFQGDVTGTLAGNLKQKSIVYQIIKWQNARLQIDPQNTLVLPQGRIKVEGNIPNLTFEFDTKLTSSAKSSWRLNSKVQGILNTKQEGKAYSGSGSLLVDNYTKLNLYFNFPKFASSRASLTKQPFNAELSLNLPNLDFVKDFTPEIKNIKGQLHADIKAQGSIAKPNLQGNIKLNQASCTIPILGLKLDNIVMEVLGKNTGWQAKGSISSDNQVLHLEGQGPFAKELQGTIKLHGDNFPIIDTKEYHVRISPKLQLTIDAKTRHISGSVLIPFAKIMPLSFTNSLSVSDDIVYADQQQVSVNNYDTTMNVAIELGKNVNISAKGLNAHLAGAINVQQQAQGPINANGALRITKGEYKAYNQQLTIEQGQLIFTGGSITNPGINLRASKKINNGGLDLQNSGQYFETNANLLNNVIDSKITVGVEVTGHITSPKVQLFSVPAVLSQADILSMMVLGRPASQANKAGGQLLMTAISSMNLGSGTNNTQIVEQLKQKLGVDFAVQTNTSYNQESQQFTDATSVVVGKSLSKRLYLSYNVGFSQSDPNIMTLKYLINKYLSFQINSSVRNNGFDLIYTRTSRGSK